MAQIDAIDDVIKALGKPAKAAALKLGCSNSRLSKWKRRGIPRGVWPDIVRICDGDVTYADLERLEAAFKKAA